MGGLIHTGLGEEGAESLVGVGGFAFFGQVTVGLWPRFVRNSCLSRTKRGVATLQADVTQREGFRIPGCRAQGSRARQWHCKSRYLFLGSDDSVSYLPAGVGDLATGLTDYPRNKCQNTVFRSLGAG